MVYILVSTRFQYANFKLREFETWLLAILVRPFYTPSSGDHHLRVEVMTACSQSAECARVRTRQDPVHTEAFCERNKEAFSENLRMHLLCSAY